MKKLLLFMLIPAMLMTVSCNKMKEENARLKRMYANLAMELDVAKYIIEKKL